MWLQYQYEYFKDAFEIQSKQEKNYDKISICPASCISVL